MEVPKSAAPQMVTWDWIPKPSPSPKTSEFQWTKVWEQIREAELQANKAAANPPKFDDQKLRKRGSEIMISSSEDDAALDSSYMKWLKPETADAIKQRILADIKERSRATKNLNLV